MIFKTDHDLVEYFLDQAGREKNYSLKTRENYQRSLIQFSEFLRTRERDAGGLLTATRNEVKGFLVYLKTVRSLKRVSQLNRLAALKSFYRFMRRRELIDQNPCDGINGLKAEKKLPTFLSRREIESFLDRLRDQSQVEESQMGAFLRTRNRALFELFYSSGIRVGEMVALQRRNIDLRRRTIRITGKGGKERMVPINQHAIDALNDYWKNIPPAYQSENIFLNQAGQPLSARGIRKILKGLTKEQKLEKPVSPHTFRHTFATHFLGEGAELRLVQEALGHASLSTTQIYTHINWERMKSVYHETHPRSGKKVNQ